MVIFCFRGLLDYQEKISKYWPEFAQNGKENITLAQFLVHSVSKIESSNATAQSRQIRVCSHTQSIEIHKGTDQS